MPNLLLLCGKQLSQSYADYHDNMNEDFLEEWFENNLSKNLLLDKNVLSVMVNVKYIVDNNNQYEREYI